METRIIIPDNDNNGAPNGAVIDRAVRAFCETFGGATSWSGRGFWVNPEGKLYAEPVTVIVSAASDRDAAKAALADLAREVLAMTDQEAVFVSVDGDAEIVSR